jgi:hypothetical protein
MRLLSLRTVLSALTATLLMSSAAGAEPMPSVGAISVARAGHDTLRVTATVQRPAGAAPARPCACSPGAGATASREACWRPTTSG